MTSMSYFPLICCGSHSANSGQKITIANTINMIRWNGMVPYTTSDSLPSQMLWITNRLMPIGGGTRPRPVLINSRTPKTEGSVAGRPAGGENQGPPDDHDTTR